MDVRPAREEELHGVCNVLDGGLLAVGHDTVTDAIPVGNVLVAVETHDRGEPPLGTLVLGGDKIRAVAVRRRRRGQGIGTALVEAALDRRGRLVAGFDGRVRPFWESLGFTLEETDEEDRYRGVLTG